MKPNVPETPPTPPTDAPAAPSPEQLEALQAQAAKADENWNHYLRAVADLENYKKRTARERADLIKYASESLIQKLIPILDNFEMAMTAAHNAQAGSADALKTGVAMIQNQFKAALVEAGLEELDATGKPFDPNWQEAVSHQESAAVAEGQVLQQLRKGYKFRDRLLRPATVVVAKQPAAPATEAASPTP